MVLNAVAGLLSFGFVGLIAARVSKRIERSHPLHTEDTSCPECMKENRQ